MALNIDQIGFDSKILEFAQNNQKAARIQSVLECFRVGPYFVRVSGSGLKGSLQISMIDKCLIQT